MRIRLIICWLMLIIFCATAVALAASEVKIKGENLPIFPGAQKAKLQQRKVHARISAFETSAPASEVFDFYNLYFRHSNCQVIGGRDNQGGYNLMTQKGRAKFSLRIYPSADKTRIEFIW